MSTIPGTNTIIDLSHWNPVNSFPDIKAGGVQAIIHKCSQGVVLDLAYATRRAAAIPSGLLWGAYHFGVASQDPVKQADFFLSMSHQPKIMALDWEWNKADTMTVWQATTFVQRIFDQTRVYPLLYTSAAFLMDHQAIKGGYPAISLSVLSRCRLWLTGFSPKPIIPEPWTDWCIWQHGLGECQGVSGQVDRDTYNGTPDALAASF